MEREQHRSGRFIRTGIYACLAYARYGIYQLGSLRCPVQKRL